MERRVRRNELSAWAVSLISGAEELIVIAPDAVAAARAASEVATGVQEVVSVKQVSGTVVLASEVKV